MAHMSAILAQEALFLFAKEAGAGEAEKQPQSLGGIALPTIPSMQCTRGGFSAFVRTGKEIQKRQIFVGGVRSCAPSGCKAREGRKSAETRQQNNSDPPPRRQGFTFHLILLGGGLESLLSTERNRFSTNMLHTKVKTEKPDLETANARNRLDAVLQCLLEKTDTDREQMEEDPGKTSSDILSKPSTRFSHHRRKKRKEMDDGLTEGGPQKQNTYIIKLFDRSVDLAQFSESTPLYPICRAWMRNSPMVREQERSPSPRLPTLLEDEEGVEVLNGKIQDVYKLPPPIPCQTNPAGEPVNLRIPFPLASEEETEVAAETTSESVPSMSTLIYKNMDRWKKIRQRWKEASQKNQLRYVESMKILKEMYERQ